MAYTLAQLAKIETQVLRKAIITNLLRYAKVMEVLPFENVSSLSSVAVRYRTLPTGITFRKVNEGYTEATDGDLEQVWESVYGFGGELKFDRVFEKLKNTIVDPKVLQTQMKLKRLGFEFNDYFINGDHATEPDGFEGLKKRVAGMPSRQTVYFAPAGGAALDVTASVANARAFLDKWEECWYKTQGGNVSAVFMNEFMYYGFSRALRYINYNGGQALGFTEDSFGKKIVTYQGAPFIDMGLKADQSTEIISDTALAGDGGADMTDVYFVSFGQDEGLTGIQLSDIDVYDPLNGGEQETTPTKLTRLDWWVGLANFGAYSIVRGTNVEGPSQWT